MRELDCARVVNSYMGYAVGRLYVPKYFRKVFKEMVCVLILTFLFNFFFYSLGTDACFLQFNLHYKHFLFPYLSLLFKVSEIFENVKLEFVKMLQESTWLDQASIKAAIDKVKTT
jgi:predicted metalloendopeptidase